MSDERYKDLIFFLHFELYYSYFIYTVKRLSTMTKVRPNYAELIYGLRLFVIGIKPLNTVPSEGRSFL